MLALSNMIVAMLKVGFLFTHFYRLSSKIQDVIVNSLPVGVIRSLAKTISYFKVYIS